jgi:hypothetical protein
VEICCEGGQGSPRAVALRKKKSNYEFAVMNEIALEFISSGYYFNIV